MTLYNYDGFLIISLLTRLIFTFVTKSLTPYPYVHDVIDGQPLIFLHKIKILQRFQDDQRQFNLCEKNAVKLNFRKYIARERALSQLQHQTTEIQIGRREGGCWRNKLRLLVVFKTEKNPFRFLTWRDQLLRIYQKKDRGYSWKSLLNQWLYFLSIKRNFEKLR